MLTSTSESRTNRVIISVEERVKNIREFQRDRRGQKKRRGSRIWGLISTERISQGVLIYSGSKDQV